MTARRDLLRDLVTLPLSGGRVALVGQPTATAERITSMLLDTYEEWLGGELVALVVERTLAGRDLNAGKPSGTNAMRFHHPLPFSFIRSSGSASERAPIVLSAVGCDWQKDGAS